jgi:hypothetical protein
MAVMLPPMNWTDIRDSRRGRPCSGVILNMKGRRMATATVPLKPGTIPNKSPIKTPKAKNKRKLKSLKLWRA